MPNLAVWHPQLVHFVIALGLVGVVLRLLSLLLRSAWLSPACWSPACFTPPGTTVSRAAAPTPPG